MTIHPKDIGKDNPRIQCDVCGQWKRIVKRSRADPHDIIYNFLGGCEFSGGGEHLAGKDVCETCCPIACKRIADERAA